MSLIYPNRYPDRYDPQSTSYPQGKFRNRSTPEAHDGGYFEQDLMNDWAGFFGALLKNGGVVPNGVVDTALNSQYYDAMMRVVGEEVLDQLGDVLSESFVNIKQFGAVGDYLTDDTQALITADIYCATNGKTLFIPNGVFRITQSIDKKSKWLGVGGCNIFTFPINDDKIKMVEGSKHLLKGSNLVFSGKYTKTHEVTDFGEVGYAVKIEGRTGVAIHDLSMEGISVVSDFLYKTQFGDVTTPLNDNRADFDVGLLLVNAERGYYSNVSVSGYWKTAGTIHIGKDPDNTNFYSLSTMGNIGLAVLGDSGTNSGLNCHSCNIGANDHHSRHIGLGEDWGQHALYFNIPSSTNEGSRNGISFFGGTVATKVDVPVKYDKCGDISYYSTVFENANQTGSSQAGGVKKHVGTSNTGSITYSSCRFSSDPFYTAGGLLETAFNAHVRIMGGNTFTRGYEMWQGLNGIRMVGDSTTQKIQLTNDPKTTTSGTVIQRHSKRLQIKEDDDILIESSGGGVNLTKGSRVVNIVDGMINNLSDVTKVSGNGDINNISLKQGAQVILIRNTSSDSWVLKNRVGNIRLTSDFHSSGFGSITLLCNGNYWQEICRSEPN